MVNSSAPPQTPTTATMVFAQVPETQQLSSLKVVAEQTLPFAVASVRDLRTATRSLSATNDFLQVADPLPAFLECRCVVFSIKNLSFGAGELARWVRALALLPGDLGSIPGTHRAAKHSLTSVSGHRAFSSGFQWHCMHKVCRHVCRQNTNTHKIKIINLDTFTFSGSIWVQTLNLQDQDSHYWDPFANRNPNLSSFKTWHVLSVPGLSVKK